MGTFDSFPDTSFLLKREGETITLNFKPGVPNTGQATIEWNIPAPPHGCEADDGRGVYTGIVIVADTKPIQIGGVNPENPELIDLQIEPGKQYTADPTVDKNLHTGDKIGDAMVIGAVYEHEKRAQGEDLTTSIVVNDVDGNTPYYVAAFATDAQFRYHLEGVRAYSDTYGTPPAKQTSARQYVRFERNPDAPLSGNQSDTGPYGHTTPYHRGGVLPTDGTGLTAGKIYQFDIEIDPTFPEGTNKRTVLVSVKGEKAGTYQDLINEINAQLAQADNPLKSPTAPDTGRYYWDSEQQKIFKWDGNEHVTQNAFVESSDPAMISTGTYWYDLTNSQLKQYDGVNWNDVDTIEYDQDPTNLTDCDDYWFDGTDVWFWEPNSSTWCERTTYIQTNDPSKGTDPQCNAYWFDSQNEILYVWNQTVCKWDQTFAIMWDVDPQNLDDNTFWFDDTNNTLNQYDQTSGTFDQITQAVFIQKTKPSNPADQAYWYDVSRERLFQYDANTDMFNELDVLIWPEDPTDIENCDLWWNTTNDSMNVWDSLNNTWNVAQSFNISIEDPFGPEDLSVGDIWVDNDQLYSWDGSMWEQISYIEFPTDPTNPTAGNAWLNTTNNTWAIWDTPTANAWNSIDPIESETDPTNISQNALWFDTNNESLFERIGSSWVSIAYSSTPLTPSKGQQYFNTTTNTLMEWSGQWVEATPLATVSLDKNGLMKFETSFVGSSSCIMIVIPQDSSTGISSSPELASGKVDYNESDQNDWWLAGSIFHHYFNHHGMFYGTTIPVTTVTADQFLFDHVQPSARIQPQVYGDDGIDPLPSYSQIGVGDDGSPDERRELMDSIRAQLGYPVVDVELTTFQLDQALQGAIENFRKRSSSGYKRGFYFLDINPGQQIYRLNDKRNGFNKIVTITSAHRFTSAFLSTAHGAGAYGQVVLQHMYNMGTYDLTSFHLVSQYIEQLEHLFATRLTFQWNEQRRLLYFNHSFVYPETVLLDCSVERPEQELFTDRWTKNWIERWSMMEARLILAEIRGKYASLPGAGGGVALNASDLLSRADTDRQELLQELEDFESDNIEEWGMDSTFVIG